MKKIHILIALCLFSVIAIAQRSNYNIEREYKLNTPTGLKSTHSITDTLMPDSFIEGSPVLYSSDNSGYVFGANGYNDLGKGQLYYVDGSVNVYGLMIWFGVNEVSTGDLSFKVWSLSETSIDEETSINIPFSEIVVSNSQEGAWYSILFENPATVSDMFIVGIQWSGLTDGFGIISTSDGDAGETDLAIEMMEDGKWYSVLDSWELDVDLAIFPYVSANSTNDSDAEILSFSFAEDYSNAEINSANATVNSVVNKGSDLTNLTPTIAVSPGAQVSGTVATDYSSPVDLVIIAADGSIKTWTVTVSESTVDVETATENNISLFPNPVTDILKLNNLQSVQKIELFSISGQLMRTQLNSTTNNSLNMQEYKPGIYLIKFHMINGLSQTLRIAKE